MHLNKNIPPFGGEKKKEKKSHISNYLQMETDVDLIPVEAKLCECYFGEMFTVLSVERMI